MENTVDNRDTRTEETVGEQPTWCPTDTLLSRLLAQFINLTQYKLFYFFLFSLSSREKSSSILPRIILCSAPPPPLLIAAHAADCSLRRSRSSSSLPPPPPFILAPSSFAHYSRPHLLLPCHPLMHLALVCPLGRRQLRQGRWWNASVPAPQPW